MGDRAGEMYSSFSALNLSMSLHSSCHFFVFIAAAGAGRSNIQRRGFWPGRRGRRTLRIPLLRGRRRGGQHRAAGGQGGTRRGCALALLLELRRRRIGVTVCCCISLSAVLGARFWLHSIYRCMHLLAVFTALLICSSNLHMPCRRASQPGARQGLPGGRMLGLGPIS